MERETLLLLPPIAPPKPTTKASMSENLILPSIGFANTDLNVLVCLLFMLAILPSSLANASIF